MKRLFVIPLAAALTGTFVNAPALKPALREAESDSCERSATRLFLLAYAYAGENPAKSRSLAVRAKRGLQTCPNALLESRIEGLIRSHP